MLFHCITKSIFAIFRRVNDCAAWSKTISMSQSTHTLMQILILKHKHPTGRLYHSYAWLNGLCVQKGGWHWDVNEWVLPWREGIFLFSWTHALITYKLINRVRGFLGSFWTFLIFLSFYHLRERIPCPYSSGSFCILGAFLVRVLS